MQRLVIRPPRVKIVLGFLGSILFVVVGAWMLVSGDTPLYERLMGAVCVVAFGWASSIFFRTNRDTRNLAVVLSPSALEFGHPGLPGRCMVGWPDVESIGLLKMHRQKLVTVRLRSYRTVLQSLSREDALALVRRLQHGRMIGYGAIAAGVVGLRPTGLPDLLGKLGDLQDLRELRDVLEGSAEVRDMVGLLAWYRRKFGAEFLFAWTYRDRSAEAFAELLERYRQRYGQEYEI